MIYDIKHVTTYGYEAPVASARCAIRLLPRLDAGQTTLSARVDVLPVPEQENERLDFFGNRVVEASIGAAHTKLSVTLAARVKVARAQAPAAGLTPAWELARTAAVASQSLAASSPAHFIFPSRLAPLHEPATAYARQSFAPGRPVLEGAADLMRRIKADFAYDPKATQVTTPLTEAFERRGGVCQDFAHIMIAGLRGLGLPAAYVSGYLRTIPPAGKPRLEGADASHAWTRVWCGPEFGWFDLDPTNAIVVGNDHIVVALGRDYADVSPIDGVILGSGKQNLDVAVDVVAVGE